MEIFDIILYFLLIIILIAFIGVLSWLIYDYNNYKDEQNTINTDVTSKLNSNLEKDKDLDQNVKKLQINTSNFLNATSNNIINYTNDEILKNKILIDRYNLEFNTSNLSTSNYIKETSLSTSNYIKSTSDILSDNLRNKTKNFSDNLNRYFKFSDITNDANTDIFTYITGLTSPDQPQRLTLMKETIADSGLKINSSEADNKYLKVCNKTGDNCYNLFVDTDNSLVAQYGEMNSTKRTIAVDSSFGPAKATAEISNGTISDIKVTTNGSGYLTAPSVIITRVPSTTPPTTDPVNADATNVHVNAEATAIIDATGKVTSIKVDNAGTGYNIKPTINIIP